MISYVRALEDQQLTEATLEEARSSLEGAKALGRPQRRRVDDAGSKPAAWVLSKLEEQIAKFDSQQRGVALTSLPSPQRIRGLAGSGKTIILAMKAALAHIDSPDANILVTFYTRSLRDHLTRMITRFYRHFGEGEPDWKRAHVQHGWGQRDLPGVYREACVRANIPPTTFGVVKGKSNPIDFVCKELVDTGRVRPFYDLVLIDEGQDFPEGFYRLYFQLAKGKGTASRSSGPMTSSRTSSTCRCGLQKSCLARMRTANPASPSVGPFRPLPRPTTSSCRNAIGISGTS